jgi:predicted small secreted protein
MQIKIGLIIILGVILLSWGIKNKIESSAEKRLPITGTWKLISGTLIEKGDTTVTWYTKNISFIKIISDTHFAFLSHDLNKGKDSTAMYSSGGGSYSLKNNQYTEQLEYCSDRQWEGNDFSFTVSIHNDTLIQKGIEKVADAGVDRLNIEKYVRVKN